MSVIAEAAAIGVFAAATAVMLAVSANADPANPDPFNPADCTTNASAACNAGPYGPDSPSALSPLNPASPLVPLNPADFGF